MKPARIIALLIALAAAAIAALLAGRSQPQLPPPPGSVAAPKPMDVLIASGAGALGGAAAEHIIIFESQSESGDVATASTARSSIN
jgi:hypothetical protein